MSNKENTVLADTATSEWDSFEKVMIDAMNLQMGIDDLNDSKGSVAGELMSLAKRFVKHNKFRVGTSPTARGDLKGDPSGFLGKCYAAEQFLKDPQRAGDFYSRVIPKCWTQAKSNIVKAWTDYGLVVTDYCNDKGECIEKKLREALNDARKKERQKEQHKASVTPIRVADLRAVGEEEAALSFPDLLNALSMQYKDLPEDQQEKMVVALVKVQQRYAKVLKELVPVPPQAPPAEGNVVINQH